MTAQPQTTALARRGRRERAAPPARERILDAAEARLLALGPAGLVLDAVARGAGVSKGGLLYHFPAKEDLVDGLVGRMLERFDAVQAELASADPGARGRWTRAYLASTVAPDGEPADRSAQLMAGILATIGNDPARLAALRERFRAWQARLDDDGIDPVVATLVRLAADGLWLSALLGLPRLDAQRSRRVLAALADLTRE
jgi:AcrR family transcriptional regulator